MDLKDGSCKIRNDNLLVLDFCLNDVMMFHSCSSANLAQKNIEFLK